MSEADGDMRACLADAVRGDRAAGERLIGFLYPLIARVVRGHVPRGIAAEDWEQEVFVRVLAGAERYRGGAPLEHWVAKVAVNVCLDQLRKWNRGRRQREVRWTDLTEAEAAVVREAGARTLTDQVAARELVERLMETLGAEDRVVVRMVDLEQRPIAEVARMLEHGESWVKVRAFRARKILAGEMARLEREMMR